MTAASSSAYGDLALVLQPPCLDLPPPLTRVVAAVGQQHEDETSAREQVGLLPHAVATISAFLEVGCAPFWTIPRACERNHSSLLPRLAARESAEMNAHYRAYLFTQGLGHAIQNGNLKMVQWLCDVYCPTGFVWEAVEGAARLGRTSILEWLTKRYFHTTSNATVVDIAMKNGHFKTLQWIASHLCIWEPCVVMALAIENDGLKTAKWLHGKYPMRNERRNAMTAIRSGHLHVAKFFAEDLGTPFDRNDAIFAAAYKGNFELLKWVHESKAGITKPKSNPARYDLTKLIRDAITSDASSGGHMETIKWLHEHYPDHWSSDTMDFAATNGFLDIVKWLHATRTEGCAGQVLEGAAGNGHLEVIE